jgi:hypothetical protein
MIMLKPLTVGLLFISGVSAQTCKDLVNTPCLVANNPDYGTKIGPAAPRCWLPSSLRKEVSWSCYDPINGKCPDWPNILDCSGTWSPDQLPNGQKICDPFGACNRAGEADERVELKGSFTGLECWKNEGLFFSCFTYLPGTKTCPFANMVDCTQR